MAHRILEICKDVVIVLLLLSIILLTLMALPASVVSNLSLPEPLAAFLGVGQSAPAAPVVASELTSAAKPLSISVRNSAGRCTIQRDFSALDAAYDRLGAYLGSALSSAGEETPVTPEDFLSALDSVGVLFSFDGQIPADALCRWHTGSEGQTDALAADFLLTQDKNAISLWLLSETPVRYKTAIPSANLVTVLETFSPDGSRFAGETESGLHPLTLWQEDLTLPLCRWQTPVTGDYAVALATTLDFNPYGAYTDPEGNTAFSETNRSLSVSTDGQVAIHVTEPGIAHFTAAEDSAAARIETVRTLLDYMVKDHLGESRLQLRTYRRDGDTVTCTFGYVVGGVPVYPDGATAVFDGTALTDLTVLVRSYSVLTDTQRLMPLSSAAVISPENARLLPAYDSAGVPGWIGT